MSRTRKILIAVGVMVLVLGGVAVALWSADGSGNGQAKALTAQEVTFAVNPAGTADLYPGFTGGDIHFLATNPNPYPVNFTGFTVGTITSSDEANCAASLVTVDTVTAIDVDVAANASSAAGTIPNVVTLNSSAGDLCQGVVFTIPVTLTGSQS
jgi:hypothetical protein